MTREDATRSGNGPNGSLASAEESALLAIAKAWLGAHAIWLLWDTVIVAVSGAPKNPGIWLMVVRNLGLWVGLVLCGTWFLLDQKGRAASDNGRSSATDGGPARFISRRIVPERPLRDEDRPTYAWSWVDLPIGAAVGWALHWGVAALYWLIERAGVDLNVDGPARSIVDKAESPWARVGLVVLVVIGAPLFEEFFYRGCVQRRLIRAFGVVPGVLGASVLFAAAHLQLVQFPGLLLVGVALGTINRRTGRAGSNTLAHAVFNLLTVLTLFGVAVPGIL